MQDLIFQYHSIHQATHTLPCVMNIINAEAFFTRMIVSNHYRSTLVGIQYSYITNAMSADQYAHITFIVIMEINDKYNERDWILKRWTQFPPLPCDRKLFVMVLFQDCSLLHPCPLGSMCRNGICTENFGRNTHPERVEKVSHIFLTRGWRVSFVPSLINFDYENDIPMIPDLILAMPYQPSCYTIFSKEYKKLHRLITWGKDKNHKMIFIIRDSWLNCVETDLALTWDFFKHGRVTPMQTAYVNYCSIVASEYVHTVIKDQEYQYSVGKYDLFVIIVCVSYISVGKYD